MRLAEHVAKTTDVDGMLDSMTPAQLDEWTAKDLIEPVGYQSQMLGFLAYMVFAWVGGSESEAKPSDFMPWLKYKKTNDINNAAAMQMIASVLGRPQHG
jgi:hypothetical protein